VNDAGRVFITGGTGYVGSRLIPALRQRGYEVLALVREQSRTKLPAGCIPVIGDALDGSSYQKHAYGVHTFIQLVGVSHPSPAKARQFVDIDLRSGLEAVRVARQGDIQHFIYVSVAHPAPVMHAYIGARVKCEEAISESGLNSTIIRPWYVLGPGHRWAYGLIPVYRLAELFPGTGDSARRLGLVTLREMIGTLSAAVDNPVQGIRIVDVPGIRQMGRLG
jgi:uncharacterized protein YbjT (DUF2867 family)